MSAASGTTSTGSASASSVHSDSIVGTEVVLVGVGNLGKALVGYGGFSRRGFEMVGLFDSDARSNRKQSRGSRRAQHRGTDRRLP